MSSLGTVPLGRFTAVDADPEPQALVDALDEQASLLAVQRLRVSAIQLLAPRLGDRLLDAGCGTGDVARTLAGLVGPSGMVVGIEPSETMLTEACRRTRDRSLPVEFRRGDVTDLEFDDASFDGARCERVLQHLAAPEAAVAELSRITRPGGRVVVIDTDWGMHAIDGADPRLTSRVVECWAHSPPNGWSGRRLPALLSAAGLRDPVVVAETLTSTDAQRPARPPFPTMAAVATGAGALTHAEAEDWLAQLVDAGRRGRFFWAFTMFAVAGTRV